MFGIRVYVRSEIIYCLEHTASRAFKKNSSGSSNVYIDHGTVMTFNTGPTSAVFNTSKTILFTATGETNQPTTGLLYPSYFAPKPSTYQELLP